MPAEFQGIGVAVAYLLVKVLENASTQRHARLGTIIHILEQFLMPLKSASSNLSVFGVDKDQLEINAMQIVWNDTKVQLCYWHATRAVMKHMQGTSKILTQSHYHPGDVFPFVGEIEIC